MPIFIWRLRVCSEREWEATSEMNSNSVEPISGFAMLAGNGYHDDCLCIDAVNQRIRKACKQEPSSFRLDLHARVRIQSNEPNDAIQFIKEFTTDVFFSCFVPTDCVIDFPIGQAEEADLHHRRYLAITSS